MPKTMEGYGLSHEGKVDKGVILRKGKKNLKQWKMKKRNFGARI